MQKIALSCLLLAAYAYHCYLSAAGSTSLGAFVAMRVDSNCTALALKHHPNCALVMTHTWWDDTQFTALPLAFSNSVRAL